MPKYSYSKRRIGAGLIILGVITLFISWLPLVVDIAGSVFLTVFLLFLIISVFLITFGAKIFWVEQKKKIGLTSFIVAIMTMCFFVIWILNIKFAVVYFESIIIGISLGIIAIIFGVLSDLGKKPRDRFGTAGIIIGLLFFIFLIIWVIIEFITAPIMVD